MFVPNAAATVVCHSFCAGRRSGSRQGFRQCRNWRSPLPLDNHRQTVIAKTNQNALVVQIYYFCQGVKSETLDIVILRVLVITHPAADSRVRQEHPDKPLRSCRARTRSLELRRNTGRGRRRDNRRLRSR